MSNKAKRKLSGWEDIADVLSHEGMKRIKTGQVLTFRKDGIEVNFKVMRMTPYKCWIKKIRLYSMNEVALVNTDTNEVI